MFFVGRLILRELHSPPPKPEVILKNFFAEPTVLLVPITSRAILLICLFVCLMVLRATFNNISASYIVAVSGIGGGNRRTQ
jgi:hypothetical protein